MNTKNTLCLHTRTHTHSLIQAHPSLSVHSWVGKDVKKKKKELWLQNGKYKSSQSASTEASNCLGQIYRFLVASGFNRSGTGTQSDLWIYQRRQENIKIPEKWPLAKENQKKILQKEIIRNLACFHCVADVEKNLNSMKILNCKLALTMIWGQNSVYLCGTEKPQAKYSV